MLFLKITGNMVHESIIIIGKNIMIIIIDSVFHVFWWRCTVGVMIIM